MKPDEPGVKEFLIARYYFGSLFRNEANKNFVSSIQQVPYIEDGEFEYALGNFTGDEINGYNVVRATFGRVRKGEIAEVYSKETKEFKKKKMPEHVDHRIQLFIYEPLHLIFFEKGSLKPSLFLNKFKKIYQKTSSYADFILDFIVEEEDVYREIKKWTKIEKISFSKLRPSNPSSDDTFEWAEEMLKDTGSVSTKIELTAARPKPESDEDGQIESPGLNADSKLIKQSLALSSHGYGEAKFTGVEGDKIKTVSTEKFIKRVTVDFYESGGLKSISQVIEELGKNEQNKNE